MTTSTPLPRFPPRALLALVATVLALGGACDGWRDPKPPAFLPSWSEARQALDWALSTWRDSPDPPRLIVSPKVQFVDQQRRPGERLKAYEILAQTDVENARQFTVRLTLENEPSPRLTRYVVIGREPVWVFRFEDYDMISHWEHKMDDPDGPSIPTKTP